MTEQTCIVRYCITIIVSLHVFMLTEGCIQKSLKFCREVVECTLNYRINREDSNSALVARCSALVARCSALAWWHGAPPWWHGAPPWWHGAPPWWHGAPPWWHGAPPWWHGVPPWWHGAPPWIHEQQSQARLKKINKALIRLKLFARLISLDITR